VGISSSPIGFKRGSSLCFLFTYRDLSKKIKINNFKSI
jgi:hypothetical protein